MPTCIAWAMKKVHKILNCCEIIDFDVDLLQNIKENCGISQNTNEHVQQQKNQSVALGWLGLG